MKQILDNLKALGKKRLAILGGVGGLVLAMTVFGASWLVRPEYRPFSSGLSSSESAQILSELESAGYKPVVSEDGTVISLPSGDIARARMVIASAGLPGSNIAGWEIFDQGGGLGMTSFTQRVQKLRALEGELAKSIRTMEPIENARVHVVLPEREAFSQDRPEATASVIVKTNRGVQLERKHALAIRNLVANAIPELSPERVTVISANGETILGTDTNDPGAMATFKGMAIEERITRNIESMIAARVGAGNVQVRVSVDVSTEREMVVAESFDAQQQVARRVKTLDEQNSNRDPRPGNVDVANNMPGFDAEGAAGSASTQERNKSQSETEFAIGNVRSEKIIEPGEVRRLSIAILVNGTMDGDQYQDRTQAELDNIAALARSASGFVADRGDELTIESMRFAEGVYEFTTDTSVMSGFFDQYAGLLIRGGIFLAALLLVGIFLVRPVMRRMLPADDAVTPDVVDTVAPAAPGAEVAAAAADGIEETPADNETMAIHAVSGGVVKRHIRDVGQMVQSHPDEALRILRGWINQKPTGALKDEAVLQKL